MPGAKWMRIVLSMSTLAIFPSHSSCSAVNHLMPFFATSTNATSLPSEVYSDSSVDEQWRNGINVDAGLLRMIEDLCSRTEGARKKGEGCRALEYGCGVGLYIDYPHEESSEEALSCWD